MAAHRPTAYIGVRGLPGWLTSGEQAGVIGGLLPIHLQALLCF